PAPGTGLVLPAQRRMPAQPDLADCLVVTFRLLAALGWAVREDVEVLHHRPVVKALESVIVPCLLRLGEAGALPAETAGSKTGPAHPLGELFGLHPPPIRAPRLPPQAQRAPLGMIRSASPARHAS